MSVRRRKKTDKVKKITVTRDLRFIDSLRFMPSSLDAFLRTCLRNSVKILGQGTVNGNWTCS